MHTALRESVGVVIEHDSLYLLCIAKCLHDVLRNVLFPSDSLNLDGLKRKGLFLFSTFSLK
jgi:hypothetical protein